MTLPLLSLATPFSQPPPQRAQGAASLRLGLSRGRVAVRDMAQQGSAKVMLPRAPFHRPEVVYLNTSGGLTSGDALSFSLDLGPDCHASATTQTAERAYLAPDGPARMRVSVNVGAGAHLDWLPQETILFEGSDLDRETTIDLATGATCLLTETVVLGRRAMGESPRAARLHDRRLVRVHGRPFWADSVILDAATLASAPNPALLGANAAFACLALIGQGAEAATRSVLALPPVPSVELAASGWNGRCVIRLVAPDLWPLKQSLSRLIETLSSNPLPRCWQMQGA
jgi:urease accessory protein